MTRKLSERNMAIWEHDACMIHDTCTARRSEDVDEIQRRSPHYFFVQPGMVKWFRRLRLHSTPA